jgi:lipoprotein-anchoring transpeptidase ErfK/SrfK
LRAPTITATRSPTTRSAQVRVPVLAALCVLIAGCGGGGSATSVGSHGGSPAPAGGQTGGHTTTTSNSVQLSITPAGGLDRRPDRGITVTATRGKLGSVAVHTSSGRVAGTLNAAGTAWHSTWALDVSQHYTVSATGTGTSGGPVTKTAEFRTFAPTSTFTTEIIEGYHQTYGVGMPIILYFNRPTINRSAVERALQVQTSKPVTGAWYWDTQCGSAPLCAYFRPHHYWPANTRVSFTGHLNGVQVAPGVFGHHTLTQSFTIGRSLIVKASTTNHFMNVYRNGRLFAHWPISTGRPGDDTPNGTYLTIEKANPVDMKGPGYNIQVPWSVRFTWSGDYLHDAYWSVGEQGFTNVSHGCVNMPPADAAIYYKMAVPGDPVTISGSPRAGVWDNGWTMWFMPWKQWLHGSAVHEAVRTGPHGSGFFHPRA